MKSEMGRKGRTINLLGEDAELAERIREHLQKAMGKLSAVQVARMAYRALAEKENLN